MGADRQRGWGDAPGFRVVPTRWIVKRTCSWPGRQRRLSEDDARPAASAEVFISLVGIRILLARLTTSETRSPLKRFLEQGEETA